MKNTTSAISPFTVTMYVGPSAFRSGNSSGHATTIVTGGSHSTAVPSRARSGGALAATVYATMSSPRLSAPVARSASAVARLAPTLSSTASHSQRRRSATGASPRAAHNTEERNGPGLAIGGLATQTIISAPRQPTASNVSATSGRARTRPISSPEDRGSQGTRSEEHTSELQSLGHL